MLVAVLVVLCILAAFLIGDRIAGPLAARRLMVRRRVVVTLIDDRTFSGVLWARRGGYLVLKGAQMHDVGERPVSMDGELVIERSKVDFLQVLSAVGAG